MNLPDLYAYLVRARRSLWAVLEAAPPEVLTRTLLGGERLRCINDLLLHTASVEDGWLHGDILEVPLVLDGLPRLSDIGQRREAASLPLADITGYWQAVEAQTLQYLAGLTEAEQSRTVRPDDWDGLGFTVDGLLWHVFLHEVRHSAQIAALLRMQQVAPPPLDLLWYLPGVPEELRRPRADPARVSSDKDSD